MRNPIEKRLQIDSIKRLSETFLGKKNFSWWALFYASLIFIVTGWLPDGIAELLRKEWVGGAYKTLISLLILLFIGIQLKNALKYERGIEVISEEPGKVDVLAVFLSPLNRKLKPGHIEDALSNNELDKNTLEGTEWEMPIKAIEYHLDKLKSVYVFTSKQTTKLMPLFTETIKRLFPSIEVVEYKPGGIEFQDIKEVFESVEELYRNLKAKNIKEESILVDITGGQATNSIAAAIATLAIGRKFQYVSTRDKKIYCYDIGYFDKE